MTTADRVRELISPLLEGAGIELVDVEHGPGLLRIFVDREGGIDLGAITECSEQIGNVLDVHDPIPGHYTLEVSSPGVERPLRTPEHFRRFVGSRVNIKTQPDVEGERRFTGDLTEADDEGVVVSGRRLAYGEIEQARTIFEWGPSPKPGKRKATTS
jgi:ribosome maturation factor RimP